MGVRLDMDTYERLRLYAYENRLSLSAAIRKLISENTKPIVEKELVKCANS
jgi:hypothetical protein